MSAVLSVLLNVALLRRALKSARRLALMRFRMQSNDALDSVLVAAFFFPPARCEGPVRFRRREWTHDFRFRMVPRRDFRGAPALTVHTTKSAIFFTAVMPCRKPEPR